MEEHIVYEHRLFSVIKRKHSSGEKRYTPIIDGKRTLISWTTLTMAKLYGEAIALRLMRKRLVALRQLKSTQPKKEIPNGDE
jgi:hypothetical protein